MNKFKYYRWIVIDWIYFKLQDIADFQYHKLNMWPSTINIIRSYMFDNLIIDYPMFPKPEDGYYTFNEIEHIKKYMNEKFEQEISKG